MSQERVTEVDQIANTIESPYIGDEIEQQIRIQNEIDDLNRSFEVAKRIEKEEIASIQKNRQTQKRKWKDAFDREVKRVQHNEQISQDRKLAEKMQKAMNSSPKQVFKFKRKNSSKKAKKTMDNKKETNRIEKYLTSTQSHSFPTNEKNSTSESR